jgi:hypothetical protein
MRCPCRAPRRAALAARDSRDGRTQAQAGRAACRMLPSLHLQALGFASSSIRRTMGPTVVRAVVLQPDGALIRASRRSTAADKSCGVRLTSLVRCAFAASARLRSMRKRRRSFLGSVRVHSA